LEVGGGERAGKQPPQGERKAHRQASPDPVYKGNGKKRGRDQKKRRRKSGGDQRAEGDVARHRAGNLLLIKQGERGTAVDNRLLLRGQKGKSKTD